MDVDSSEELFLYYLMCFIFSFEYNCVVRLTQGELYLLRSYINRVDTAKIF